MPPYNGASIRCLAGRHSGEVIPPALTTSVGVHHAGRRGPLAPHQWQLVGTLRQASPPSPRAQVGNVASYATLWPACIQTEGAGVKSTGRCCSCRYWCALCLVTWQTHPRDVEGWCQHPSPNEVPDTLLVLEHSLRFGGQPRVR